MPTSTHLAELTRYVAALATANPPRNGRIQVSMFDHVAWIDHGALQIGTRSEVKVPTDVRSAVHELHLKEGLRGLFARRLLAIERERSNRYLIVYERERVLVDGNPTVRTGASILYWNGKAGADARLTT